MRSFIVLCLVAIACADKLGYNYRPVERSQHGLSFAPGGSSGHVSGFDRSTSVNNDYGSSNSGGLSYGGYNTGFGVGGLGHSNGDFITAGSSNVGGSHIDESYAPQVELEKEFYTFTANEDDFRQPAAQNQFSNTAKKSLRVIFIKGPENHSYENAALSVVKNAIEQRTAIYVLTKEADVNNLTNKLKVINSNINNKPEVHFVKYRTLEDAANAQKAIQSHYDSLGGSSQNYNGGIAKILNFASKAPAANHGSHGSLGSADSSGSFGSADSTGSVGSFGSSGTSAPTSIYLPA